MSGRRRLSFGQKRELWSRWKNGETLSQIAVALSVRPNTIFGTVNARGGFAPPGRRRRPAYLSLEEREEISRGLNAGMSLTAIASRLERAVSTVSREVERNGGRQRYRASQAEAQAWRKARRPKACALAQNPDLRDAVAGRLADDWSPQQISAWLRKERPKDARMQVSHETIYKSLFIQARGVLKRELLSHLRSRRLARRAKTVNGGAPTNGIKDTISIRERPAEALDRAVPGHWEGDLLSGGGNTHIATLVERSSRFVMLVKLKSKDSQSVAAALARHIAALPRHMKASLAWDRGSEMGAHKQFTMASKVAVYFCDPYSPWQRGSNENTNGLLRQYFPKGSDLGRYSQKELDAVARKLNTRPRKTLGYDTPADIFSKAVAATG